MEYIRECLAPSSKFYAVTMNDTFMKQDRVYFPREFTEAYIEPLMEGRKTLSVQVQASGGISTNLILHISTDGRCNLKKGWMNFTAHNHIYVGLVCIFHFYKETRVEVTIDIL